MWIICNFSGIIIVNKQEGSCRFLDFKSLAKNFSSVRDSIYNAGKKNIPQSVLNFMQIEIALSPFRSLEKDSHEV